MGALRAGRWHPCSHMLGSPFISLKLITDSKSPLISEVFRHSREFHFTSSLSAPSPNFSHSGARHLKTCLMAQFPQEIIDAVIDEVQNSSPSPYLYNNLSRCSLVCHSFLPRSRKHLFSSIALTSNGRHSWTTFHDRIFKPSPEIMPMILSVALSSGDRHGVEEDRIIYTLLAAMRNLRHVNLSSGFPGNGGTHWRAEISCRQHDDHIAPARKCHIAGLCNIFRPPRYGSQPSRARD